MRFVLLILAVLSSTGLVRGQDPLSGAPTPAPVPQAATAPALLSVTVSPGAAVPSASLHLDRVASSDPDVVAAVVSFTALDSRYQELAPESYYGARLEAVNRRIASDGLTPANKGELLAVYQGATAALKAFLATRP